jgi:exodeoxyribonuclease V alpha subunit
MTAPDEEMTTTATSTDSFPRLFPGLSEELAQLYQKAAENAALSHTDFYTIRDLLELSGLEAEEPLHVLLLGLLLALEEGSLCLEIGVESLAQRLADLVDESTARAWAQRILDSLDRGAWGDLIGSACQDSKPLVLLQTESGRYVYFQKYLRDEQTLCDQLRQRTALPATATAAPNPDILREVLDTLPLRIGAAPMQLNQAQRRALDVALRRNLAIISGGPGTGKTSIVVTLLRCLLRAGIPPERIALAAPTGRAAQRLTEALRVGLQGLEHPPDVDRRLENIAASTLHQLLRYMPKRGIFLQHAENPLRADVVIVDEVSMIGVSLMAQLFQALAPETRLILLGDKDQLASVDAGAVLANLLAGNSTRAVALRDALVVLEENYRSQPQIQAVAGAINRQEAGVVDTLSRCVPGPAMFADLAQQGGCWLLESASARLASWRELLEQWGESLTEAAGSGDPRRALADPRRALADPRRAPLEAEERAHLDALFAALNRARILTLVREGPWGCEGINKFLEQRLRPRLDRGSRGALFAGAPVLITRNDRPRQLFNGDVGLTLRHQDGGYRVVFQRLEGYLAIPADALPPHELAFAMTVHKSQGSEYERVLLVLPPEGGRRLLTKEIIYTGITRAKQLAVVCAPPDVLRFAISRRIERQSALLRAL